MSDEELDSMSDEELDNFARGLVESVRRRSLQTPKPGLLAGPGF